MTPLLWATFRQKYATWVNILIAAVTAGGAACFVWWDFVSTATGYLTFCAALLALIFGHGLVSKDLTTGSLQLLLARPISRQEYLWGKFLGTFLALTAPLLLGFLLAFVLETALRGNPPWALVSAQLLSALLLAFWWLALVLLGSVLSPPGKSLDQLLPLGTLFLSNLVFWAADGQQWTWLRKAGFFALKNLVNSVSLENWDLATWPWRSLLRWAANTSLALALAFWAFNQKELGYGKD
jgi:hypothetical protein